MCLNWESVLAIGKFESITPVAGGDINHNYHVITETGHYFLKCQPNAKTDFFEAEVAGLIELGNIVQTPTVLKVGEVEQAAFLLLTYINQGSSSNPIKLGEQLAKLHQHTGNAFGFEKDNYIGKLKQYNGWQDDWANFYIEKRLQPQINLARKYGYWSDKREDQWQFLRDRISSFFQTEKVMPSLLHGDLWNGNVLFNQKRDPLFIDPAVYYGDRMVDIAMTQLFGGFSTTFYEAYQKNYPFSSHSTERIGWYQLYYLLAHLNMFGSSYLAPIDRILAAN